MKGLKRRCASQASRRGFALIALAIAALFVQRPAQAAVLTSLNSSMNLNLGTSAGMTSWTVDGVNQVNQQWFWVRAGSSGPQFDLSHINSSPYVTTLGSQQLTALYTNGASLYGAQVTYTLVGSAAGSGKSGVSESLTLYNNTSSSQQFSLFLYSDFILRGDSVSQVVQIGSDGNGDSTVTQTMATFPSAKNSFVVNSADRVEAALDHTTLNGLTSGSAYSLNNNVNSGPGNATWALEWDFTVGPNSSAQISALDNLQVPEPSSIALILLGFGAWAWRRQRSPS